MGVSYEELSAVFDGVVEGDEASDEIASDYVRLFVTARGGAPAPPYASWYLDGTLLGPTTAWVDAEYRREGLELAPDAGHPADYLSCELEFLFFLARHEQAARETGDGAALSASRAAQLRFLDGHLLRWLPSFVARARDARPGAYFAARLAELERFVSEERARLVNS